MGSADGLVLRSAYRGIGGLRLMHRNATLVCLQLPMGITAENLATKHG